MFRWGILSSARIARDQLLPAFADADNGVISAIASRDMERAQHLADRFGAPHAFASYEDLLASDDVDGVYIPLPTSQHAEWTIRAAQAGKHVLCEKPIALSADQIDPIIAAQQECNVLISEAFMVYYHPQWKKVRALIEEGAVGRLRHIDGVFTYFNTDPDNMRNRLDLGGGGLPDIGVYPTVTSRLSTGAEPLRIQARVERDQKFGTDIYASVRADFGPFELTYYCSTQMALRQSMLFHGDKGFIEVHAPFNAGDYDQAHITLYNQSYDHAEVFRFPGVRQYRLQAETFARAAQGEDVAIFSLDQSKLNQRVIDATYQAGESGDWVDL